MGKGEELFGNLYSKGEIIFRQGDSGEAMYIIQSGAVEVFREDNGKKTVLAHLGPGELFGEMALIDDRGRTATIKTLSRCRLLPITRKSLLARTTTDTGVIFALLEILVKRLDSTNRLLKDALTPFLNGDLEGGDENGQNRIEDDPPPEHDLSKTHGRAANEDLLAMAVERFGSQSVSEHPAGEIIFREGDEARKMYLVVEGSVSVEKGDGPDAYVLAILGPGDFLGEMALFSGGTRSATARTMSSCSLLGLSLDDFESRMKDDTELSLFILQLMILRHRNTFAIMEEDDHGHDYAVGKLPPLLKKSGKIRLALASLSSCSGCMVRLLEEPDIGELLEKVEVVYSPLLMDQESFVDCDIAIVDGAVRVAEDLEVLEEIRKKSRYLVAWGTCAAAGGIPRLANLHPMEELLETTYGNTQDTFDYYLSGSTASESDFRERGLSLLRRVGTLDNHVRVDYFLPGCPPEMSLFRAILTELTEGEENVTKKKIVCTECPRKVTKDKPDHIRVYPINSPDTETCFTSSGILCLGFMTAGNCYASCPSGGLPCWGCRGPSGVVLRRVAAGEDLEQVMVESLARRCKVDQDEARGAVRVIRHRGNGPQNFEDIVVSDIKRIR